jgi:DNA invertase Pin-like site-specific DNA recombinase
MRSSKQLLASIAEFERELIVERTSAGQKRAMGDARPGGGTNMFQGIRKRAIPDPTA